MSAQLDWAFAELERRRREEALFPVPPSKDAPGWSAYSTMKVRRRKRRKLMGYSKGTADRLVELALQQEAGR